MKTIKKNPDTANIRYGADLIKKIDKKAEELNLTRSAYIKMTMSKAVK